MVNRLWLAAVVLSMIMGCTSLPAPEDAGNSLVVGRLTLDFPDGFFAQPAKTLRVGIKVDWLNTSTGKTFATHTSDGYFFFLSNGLDSYVLRSYEYKTESGAGGFTIGPVNLDKAVNVQPGKVIYLGDLTMTYAKPRKVKLHGYTEYYDFDISAAIDWHVDELRGFFGSKDSASPWLDYEVFNASIYGK